MGLASVRTLLRLCHSVPSVLRLPTLRTPTVQRLATCAALATDTSAQPAAAAAPVTPWHLEAPPWDHSFVSELPGDPEVRNEVRQVNWALWSPVSPTPAKGEPRLVSYSRQAAQLMGLDPLECERPEFPLLFSGAAPLPGARPFAQCYGGHQFQSWAGQLGDGRAISLGEVLVGDAGVANPQWGPAPPRATRRWELQLKGAGRTPYSRRADGRAVLRSSLREFVTSEALAALGVPTTRALSLVATGDQVLRDMFYDGRAALEPGAVVCRVAPSFVRFGTFQLPASRANGQEALARLLADYVIKHHFPHLLTQYPPGGSGANGGTSAGAEDAGTAGAGAVSQGGDTVVSNTAGGVITVQDQARFAALLQEACQRTGQLIAMWQSLGWTHGVMNTDNMSILGITLDIGPCGFLDRFDPTYTPNTTDFNYRIYSFRAQPESGQFNCLMLANAFVAAGLVTRDAAQAAVDSYPEALEQEYEGRMAAKLGLQAYDKALSAELLQLMYTDKADFTNTYRALASVPSASPPGGCGLPPALLAALGSPQLAPEREAAWQQWLQAYQARLRAEGVPEAQRQAAQNRANPKFVARQHLMHLAIQAAEQGDYSELETLMTVLEHPYEEQPHTDPKYCAPPPEELIRPGVCVLSCSS